MQLADNHTLSPVNDKSPARSDERQFAKEHILLQHILDLLVSRSVGFLRDQPQRRFKRRGERHVALFALNDRVARMSN